MQVLPQTITRRHWYGTVIYHKLSEEKSTQFFTAIAGEHYTKPVTLYYGEDKQYYFGCPLKQVDRRTGDCFLLHPTGVLRKDIYDMETKTYRPFTEQKLRDVLYNLSCVYQDREILKDEKFLPRYKTLYPLKRNSRKTMIDGDPIPKKDEDKWLHDGDDVYGQFLYSSPKTLITMINEDEINSIMNAVYGRTDDNVVFYRDLKTGELFVYYDMVSKNLYDFLQRRYHFDYDFLEKYVHIYEKFDKTDDMREQWLISRYFLKGQKTFISVNRCGYIRTGVKMSMLKKSNSTDPSHKYLPLSFDDLQKAYMRIIYCLWQLK